MKRVRLLKGTLRCFPSHSGLRRFHKYASFLRAVRYEPAGMILLYPYAASIDLPIVLFIDSRLQCAQTRSRIIAMPALFPALKVFVEES